MILAGLRKKIRDRAYCYLPLPDYYGRDFKRIYAFLLQSCHWSREQLQAYKLERIRALLSHAQEKVPYYRDLFKTIGLDSRDIKTLQDYSQIPILSRKNFAGEYRAAQGFQFQVLQAPTHTNFRDNLADDNSLSQPIPRNFSQSRVLEDSQSTRSQFRDRWVNIICRNFDPKSPIFEHNRLENCLLINGYHIIRGCRDEILEGIREFQPSMIWTHPSPLGILRSTLYQRGFGQ